MLFPFRSYDFDYESGSDLLSIQSQDMAGPHCSIHSSISTRAFCLRLDTIDDGFGISANVKMASVTLEKP